MAYGRDHERSHRDEYGRAYAGEGPRESMDDDRASWSRLERERRERFGAGDEGQYFGTGSYGHGGSGYGGGYGPLDYGDYRDDYRTGRREPYFGALGYRDDIDQEYGNPTYGGYRERDRRPDHTSRRAHGENPYGYYGQYRPHRDYDSRERYYSGGYDEGRVSTWRPEARRPFRRGPKGYRRSDERIREDISDRLTQSAYIDSSEVTVDVSNGEVTLEGTVPERRMKHAIEDLAESCAGVEDVHNRLRVQRESGEQRDSSSPAPQAPRQGNAGRGRDRANG